MCTVIHCITWQLACVSGPSLEVATSFHDHHGKGLLGVIHQGFLHTASFLARACLSRPCLLFMMDFPDFIECLADNVRVVVSYTPTG